MMNTIKTINNGWFTVSRLTGKLSMVAVVLAMLASCQKSFDPDSYKPDYTIGGYTSSSEVAAANQLAYWAFDGGYIDSVTQTEGTPEPADAVSFVDGITGQSARIASPGAIQTHLENKIAALNSFTIACWLRHPDNLDADGKLFSYIPWSLNEPGYSWEQSKFFMLFNNADNSAGTYGKVCLMDQWFDKGQVWPAMLDGNWHNLALSYDGSSGAMRIYIDGAIFSETQNYAFNPQNDFGSATSFTIGGPDANAHQVNGWMNSLSGDIDEFRVYSKVLSGDDIHALYLLQLNGL
ncbi:hypothetical protein GCM10027566_26840 [Arachidicoccus ginsenosidivorans]|jgi:hypothetical protein|uniref:LamG domain-containing protein n=1 Tax=Arachidicoccus ginsenosidivorans TaxID=496057 RepID=A0A5B8VSJ4_9BACT|nr:LamG domain-containing protein [Arachidicoccus ginsenosidivorans]QEC73565.1 LamG domain-containing protein [Arachidicoccus ginsenosidivorans]